MVAPRSLARAATVLVTIGACRGWASGAKITLRYTPPTGAAYHYSLDQQNAMRIVGGPMSALPEQTFRMRMYYTQVVKGPAQGGALHDLGVIHAHPEGLLGQGAHRSTHDPHRVLLIERVVVGRTRRGGVAQGDLGSARPTTAGADRDEHRRGAGE